MMLVADLMDDAELERLGKEWDTASATMIAKWKAIEASETSGNEASRDDILEWLDLLEKGRIAYRACDDRLAALQKAWREKLVAGDDVTITAFRRAVRATTADG